jgi:outer membrane protein OmpA-like peptidoglycan-associated protein
MTSRLNRSFALALMAVLAATSSLVGGCEPPPPAPPPASGELNLARSVGVIAADLAAQLGPGATLPRTLSIDPLLDGRTGQQTRASERVQVSLAAALGGTLTNAKLVPFDGAGAAQAQFLISGTLNALPEPDHYRMSAALSDRQSGIVVAQAVATFREPGMDPAPTRFYTDSPSLVRDRSIEGYLKTAETPKGGAADALYIEQVPTAALLAEALAAYNAEHWEDALARYTTAVQRPDGQQLRTFNGIYLCQVQLGRLDAAEEAFGKIAALGLATNNLAVKLLFRPGGTDFWPDPKVTSLYPMWLRQIARAAQAAGSCLDVVGHTSHSGSEAINDKLSLARASAIRDALYRQAPGLYGKAKVSGVGFRENLIGTGKDDASDALDRRVEFKVVACASSPPLPAPAPAPAATSAAPMPAAAKP